MYANMDYGMIQNNLSRQNLRIAAIKGFEQARQRSRIAGLFALLTGRSRQLASLENQPINSRPRSNQVVIVPIEQIKGSLGRTMDFDADFYPLKDHNRERWSSVAEALMRNIPLPPVELVQGPDGYYVQDGHHRISVARWRKQDVIEARIMN